MCFSNWTESNGKTVKGDSSTGRYGEASFGGRHYFDSVTCEGEIDTASFIELVTQSGVMVSSASPYQGFSRKSQRDES